MFKGIPVVLESVKYVTYHTPTGHRRHMIDALQILATYIPQYHKFILARVKMHIFVCTKFASSSKFECNSNTLIFSLIRHELSELHEFYKMCPEMEIFRGTPSVLQTAIIAVGNDEHYG